LFIFEVEGIPVGFAQQLLHWHAPLTLGDMMVIKIRMVVLQLYNIVYVQLAV